MKKTLLTLLLGVAVANAADKNAAALGTLSEGVHSLLTQEMFQIEQGMHEIFSSMIRGEYAPIVKTATKIQESFIFKKSLTDAQRRELKAKLPAGFIALDRSFHELAGDLAASAEFEDKRKVAEDYARMTQKCIQCHSTYAGHRFPHFADE